MEQWYLYKKKADFNQIGEKFNIDPVIARLIRNRDVVGDEQIQQYLYGELSDISDPFLMKGVKEGVEILKQKVQKEKQNYENSCNAYSDDFGYELLCVCRYILLLLISLLFGYDHQWN